MALWLGQDFQMKPLTAMATANDLSVTFGQLELDFELKFGLAQYIQVTVQYNFFLE